MAQLKDTLVSGNLRVTDTILADIVQVDTIKARSSSASTTMSPGTAGQLLISNGTNVYWDTWVGSGNITTVGTISTGVWNATEISAVKGGTGITTYTKGDILYASAANTLAKLAANTTTTKKFLTMTSSTPSWGTIASGDLPSMYIGTTQVQYSSAAQALSGITTLTTSGKATLNSLEVTGASALKSTLSVTGNTTLSSNVYLGTSGTAHTGWTNGQYLQWDNTNKAWHLIGNFYADGFVSSGGLSSASGTSGIDLNAMWDSLTENDSSNVINASHLPLSVSGGTAASGQYVSGISYSNGTFTVSKTSLPSAYTLPMATYNTLGGVKPVYSTTGAATFGTATNTFTNSPAVAARTTTSGRYYAVEIDKNGRLFVNVPWTAYSSGTADLLNAGTNTENRVWQAKIIADYVKAQINTAVSSALYFRGESSTEITNGGTETATIGGNTWTASTGDLILYGGKEFAWDGSKWIQLGDESSWAAKTTSITGTGYLTGGGTLESNRTLDVSSSKITNNTSATAVTASTNLITANTLYYHKGNSNIVTVGTITSGTWNGTAVTAVYGGTGMSGTNPFTGAYRVVYTSSATAMTTLAPNTTSTKKFLRMTGTGSAGAAPAWDTVSKSDVGLGSVENTALSTWTGSGNITTVGTISSGTWSGTKIAVDKGGTGKTTWTQYGVVYASANTTLDQIANNTTATRKFLRMVGNGTNATAPTWDTVTKTDVGLGNVDNTADANKSVLSATKLTTVSKTIWGQTYWTSGGIPQDVTAAPNLYIGRTKVLTSAANDTLLGITAISNAATSGSTDVSRIVWDSTNNAWHFLGNLYADGFVSSGGLSNSSGTSGIDENALWDLLDATNEVIGVSHIPNITVSKVSDIESWITNKGFVTTDTKNTAGATTTNSKIYLVGALTQTTNPQTYSNGNVYAEAGNLHASKFNGPLETSYDDTTNNLSMYKSVLAKRKVYTNVLGVANGSAPNNNSYANQSFYFLTIVPKSWDAQWSVKYTINVHLDNETQTYKSSSTAGVVNAGLVMRGTYVCNLNGTAGTVNTYHFFQSQKNTSYRPIYYHMVHETTSAGYTAGYGHKIGVSLVSSYIPTPVTDYSSGSAVASTRYPRTIEIVLEEAINCTAVLSDNLEVEADAYRSDYSKLNSTYYTTSTSASNSAGRWNNYSATTQGLYESSDDNTYTFTQQTYNYLKNATKNDSTGLRIFGYNLIGFNKDGNALGISVYSSSRTTNITDLSVKGTRLYCTEGFDYTKGIRYSNSSSVFAANADMNISTAINYTALDLRYSDNCLASSGAANAVGMVARKPVYLRGTIGTDGLFYLAPIDVTYNSKTYQRAWVQDIPSVENENGEYVYWFIGYPYYNSSYPNSLYQLDLYTQGELVWYKDGNVRPYVTTAKLNTNNTTAQSVNSSENISGVINLHKIAKTGTYSDLISKPASGLTSDLTTGTSTSDKVWSPKAIVDYLSGAYQSKYGFTISGTSGASYNLANFKTTDANVTQTATTTNSAYELLFSYTADNTNRTEGARKTSTLTYNPSTKALVTGGTVNGLTLSSQTTGFKISGGTTSKTLTVNADYTLAAACAKAVDTSISAASTSVNLPTSAAVASFVEGKGYLLASEISAWAKESTKPSYAFSEITGTVSASQIGTLTISKIAGLQAALDEKADDDDLGSFAYISSLAFSSLTNKPTTLDGYNISDAYIENGVIILGENTITPLTSISTLSLFGKTYNGTANISITLNDIQNSLDSVYHPRGGDATLSLAASTLNTSSAITVGNGHTGTIASEDGYRKIFFGSPSHYISLKNFGTEQSPNFGFYFSDGIVSESFVSAGGLSDGEGGGSGGGGGIEHVLLSQSEWEALTNPDPSIIYLIYED